MCVCVCVCVKVRTEKRTNVQKWGHSFPPRKTCGGWGVVVFPLHLRKLRLGEAT